jgi:hypothetical protein
VPTRDGHNKAGVDRDEMLPSTPANCSGRTLTIGDMSMFNLFLMAVVFIGSFAIAITTATFNVVGGFAITDRMLRLFKGKKKIS